MAHKTGDRIKETTTTTGTGALTLAGAVSQFRAFSDVCANADTIYYSVVGQTGTEWEVGLGTWNTGNTLTRTTVLSSSNAGAAVTLSAGTKDVFCTLPAAPIVGGQVFPVGYVFLSVVSTSPATLLGYGTWSAFGAGRMLVGIDSGDTDFDTVEETGGSKTHTLAESEMPSHTHVATDTGHGHNISDPGHSHTQGIRNSGTAGTAGAQGASTANNASAGTTGTTTTGITIVSNSASINVDNTGGGGAHNNMPPYIVVYMWKRTA